MKIVRRPTNKRTDYPKQYKKKRPYRRYIKFNRNGFNYNMNFIKRYTGAFTVNLATSAGTSSFTGSTLSLVTPAVAGTNFYTFGFGFKLSDLPSYSEIQNMYDVYKIVGVALRIFPLFSDSSTATTGSVQGMGTVIHSVIDLDDGAAPTASEAGVSALREYGNSYKCHNMLMTKKWSRYVRPRTIGLLVDNAGANVQAQSNKAGWVDCAQPNIMHYGIKCIIETNTFSAVALSMSFKVEAKYYIKARCPI